MSPVLEIGRSAVKHAHLSAHGQAWHTERIMGFSKDAPTRYVPEMNPPECPQCSMSEILEHPDRWECVTCGHEWERSEAPAGGSEGRIVKDAHGTVLADGDVVVLIKDLKLKGSSQVIKGGTKTRPIRLVDGDHEISCKIDGSSIGLKACFVRKA
jgi:protein PhnA